MFRLSSLLGPIVGSVPSVRRLMVERDQYRQQADESLKAAARDRARADEVEADAVRLRAEVDQLKLGQRFAPPGHFYSPFPSLEELARDDDTIFGRWPREIPGIDLREREQLALLERFAVHYRDLPFQPQKTDGLRYYFENSAFSYSDAICLYAMIREASPRRLIEVGSGFSSCVTLDTNERFLGGVLQTTFIEPYPELLRSLLKPGDAERIRIIPSRLQDVDPREFEALGENDILFIDSTHVSKVNSDVNHLLFNVLPGLARGVYVHIHDIQYPFEYPKHWVLEGRAWTEAYLVRAFLQYNSAFRIVLMNTFMERFHQEFFERHLPWCLRNPGGSLWLQRT